MTVKKEFSVTEAHLFSWKTSPVRKPVCINMIYTKAHSDKMSGKSSVIPRMPHRKHLVKENKGQTLSLVRVNILNVIIFTAVKEPTQATNKWHCELYSSYSRTRWGTSSWNNWPAWITYWIGANTEWHKTHTPVGKSKTAARLHKMLASCEMSDRIHTV